MGWKQTPHLFGPAGNDDQHSRPSTACPVGASAGAKHEELMTGMFIKGGLASARFMPVHHVGSCSQASFAVE